MNVSFRRYFEISISCGNLLVFTDYPGEQYVEYVDAKL